MFPPQLPLYSLTLDWRILFGCDLHIADCVRKKRELSCCLTLSFLGGGGTVTAGSLFAAAAKDATEDFFGSRPVSFLGAFFVGIVLLVCFLDGTVLLVIISVGRIARCDIYGCEESPGVILYGCECDILWVVIKSVSEWW